MNRDDLLELIPAYVLGALDPDEQAEVEALLVDDVEAQAIADEYRQMMGNVLPMMAESRAPAPNLKNKLMAQIQTSPTESDPTDAVPDQPIPSPEHVTSESRPATRILRLTLFVPIAAALIFAVIGLGIVLQDFANSQTPQGIYIALSTRDDSTRVTVGGTADSPIRGELVVAQNNEQAVIRLSQLPDLTAEQTFQLWLIDDSGAQSGGLFQSTENNEAYLVVPNDKPINQYAAFGVSVEPEGGSPLPDGPSSDPIIGIAPPADASQSQ